MVENNNTSKKESESVNSETALNIPLNCIPIQDTPGQKDMTGQGHLPSNCTRCKIELIPGRNIAKNWHIPICRSCRESRIRRGDWSLTKEEKKVMDQRMREDHLA